jgi:FKBP-type peptidyl-prolyl cis-trans isomerase
MKTYIWAAIGVVVIVLVVVFSNGHKNTTPSMDQNTTSASSSATADTTTKATTPTTMDLPTDPTPQPTATALKTTVIKQGTGTGAVNGDTVTVNYTGTLADGTTFDSNVDPKFGHVAPFAFKLGAGMVIKGWDMGVLGMKVGEKRHLIIPSSLGYGASGYGPIPGNAELQFDVQVTAISHS